MKSKLHNKNIGLMLKKMREHRKLTQVKLALDSNITRQTINNIESGRISTTIDSLAALAGVLNCNLDVSLIPRERE